VTCRQLVEGRDGVAVTSARRAGDERERRLRGLDAFAVGHAPEESHELGKPRPREDEGLAARPDRRKHLRQVRRAEDEDEVGRRLLDQLQEGVEGGIGQLVRLVEDVDLVAALDRLEDDPLADLADVVDATLRRCVHLDHVEGGAARDRDTCVAHAVGIRRRALGAVERLGEDAGQRRLTGSARAREEVRLAHLPCRDRVPQGADDGLLAHHFVEVLRAIFAVKRGHAARLRF
jgi:hypothetical protein